jgi:hypothetical protein
LKKTGTFRVALPHGGGEKQQNVPAPSKVNLVRQICNFIPEFLVSKIARETGAEE